jgi:hypothetical protein
MSEQDFEVVINMDGLGDDSCRFRYCKKDGKIRMWDGYGESVVEIKDVLTIIDKLEKLIRIAKTGSDEEECCSWGYQGAEHRGI